jgi:hypothetical protein
LNGLLPASADRTTSKPWGSSSPPLACAAMQAPFFTPPPSRDPGRPGVFFPCACDTPDGGSLGFALERRAGGFVDVYPFPRLQTYLRGLANDVAGPVPGASAYAGIGLRDDPARGVVIVSSCLGDPGDSAGLKRGDVIRAADSRPVGSASALVTAIKAREPEDLMRLEVSRGKQRRVVTLKLGYVWAGAGC